MLSPMPDRTTIVLAAGLGLAALTVRAASAQAPTALDKTKVVLFVCEHGAAKSVIAAAHFNLRARERKLPYRALAKGTDPQEQLSEVTVKALTAEGLTAMPPRPERVTAADVAGAARVVTFGCDLSKVAPSARSESWADVPSPGADYAAARDAIDRHLDALIAELGRRAQ